MLQLGQVEQILLMALVLLKPDRGHGQTSCFFGEGGRQAGHCGHCEASSFL